MTTTIYLLVDPRGWPAALDPEMVNAILQAFLRPQLVVDVYACEVGDRWFEDHDRLHTWGYLREV